MVCTTLILGMIARKYELESSGSVQRTVQYVPKEASCLAANVTAERAGTSHIPHPTSPQQPLQPRHYQEKEAHTPHYSGKEKEKKHISTLSLAGLSTRRATSHRHIPSAHHKFHKSTITPLTHRPTRRPTSCPSNPALYTASQATTADPSRYTSARADHTAS